jgi:alkylation response protein AidB-like acyl-CoA dehydrogenase
VFDLELDDIDQAIVETGRRLGLEVIDPHAWAADRDQTIDPGVRAAVHAFGFTAPIAEDYGGHGVPTAFQQMLALEALGYGDPGLTGVLALTSAAALVISSAGSTDQCQQWLLGDTSPPVPPLALYEGFGRAPDDYETSITAEGGRWRVKGKKVGVALSDSSPSHILAVGRDDGARQMRAAFVPVGVGVTIDDEANPQASQGFIALSLARFADVDFDVVIDTADLLGAGKDVSQAVAVAAARTRLVPAAITLGGAQRAREYATKYAIGREAFGSRIFDFQGVSFPLVDNQIKIDAARLSLWNAASELDNEEVPEGAEAGISRVVNEVHAAATCATRDAIQTLGGHGFLTDHPLERWYRCAALFSALDSDPLYTRFEPAV